jgi:hypothetical protein
VKKTSVIGNRTIYSIMVLIILLGSSLFIAVNSDGSGNNHIMSDHYASTNSNSYGPIVPVATYIPFYSQYGVSKYTEDNGTPASLLTVVVSLYPSNETLMNSLLSEINDPASPLYHHFLSLNQYNEMFGGPQNVYSELVKYLKSSGAAERYTKTIGFKATEKQYETYRRFAKYFGNEELIKKWRNDLNRISEEKGKDMESVETEIRKRLNK